MSLAKRFIGVSPVTAQSLQGDANNAITAAGTTISGATELTNTMNIVTTATSLQGVKLSTGIVCDSQLVLNRSGVTIYVYPSASTSAINQLVVGNPMQLANNTSVLVFVASATQHVAFLSA